MHKDLYKRDETFEFISKLICPQQTCPNCEAVEDLSVDCEQCGKRIHVFRQDHVDKFIDYLRLSRPIADVCYFTQRRLFLEVLRNEMGAEIHNGGCKILSRVVEDLHILDSVNYLPVSLKSTLKSLDFNSRRGAHFFSTVNNLDYVVTYVERKYHVAGFIAGDERAQFSAWYGEIKDKIYTTGKT